MNYEEFLAGAVKLVKELDDSTKAVQKLSKAISKDLENGNIKDAWKNADQFGDALERQRNAAEAVDLELKGFDAEAYFNSGEFAGQLLDACRERNIDVHGDYPVYEMFPDRVRIDTENQDLYLNRKKVPCMRPEYFADMIKKNQDKLNSSTFRAEAFAEDLASAYDVTLLKTKKKDGAVLLLTAVYKTMVPLSRSRKEYDQQAYAFDIARLYAKSLEMDVRTKDGRRVEFGPSRNNGNAIRILDQGGKEQYLGTVRFFKD